MVWKQTRFTKEQLKESFELTEVNEYRPLMASLTNSNLINGRKLTPTSKLIKLAKILLEDKSEGGGGMLFGDVTSDKSDKTTQNLITSVTPDTSKQDSPPTHTLECADIACNGCSTVYKNTTQPLEFMQKLHSESNPGHTLYIVEGKS